MIELEKVDKVYAGPLLRLGRGRVRALDDITLTVPPGASLGLVGPNGAGKSTLIRLLLGYLQPTSGSVLIAGLRPRSYAERYGISYVPERPAIRPRWTVRGALAAFAALGDVEQWTQRVEAELLRLGLEPLADRPVGTLSKGNLQRLTLAQALLGGRKLMVLDEPTDGVDPDWVARVRAILEEWRREDRERVLLYASHNLDEVERVADRVAILAEGRLREVLDLRTRSAALPLYRLEVRGDADETQRLVRAAFPGAVALEDGGQSTASAWQVSAADLASLNQRLTTLISQGLLVEALVPDRPTLEQQFRRSLARPGPPSGERPPPERDGA